MAEYTVRVNAADSYMKNIDTGRITRGAVLTATESGHYHYANGDSGVAITNIRVLFPSTVPAGYEKKRLKQVVYHYFITARQGSASGALPSGASFCFNVSDSGRRGFQPGEQGSGYFNGVPQNGYWVRQRNIQQIAPELSVSVYAGSTDYYNNVTYSYNASASMQSHTAANPPYAEYIFEDVTPSVTGARPTSGFVNEKDAVEVAWDMTYNADGVQQLTAQNAKFRYRNAGASGYTELDYLRDKTSAWSGSPTRLIIPANSGRLPQSGGWEWQVLVQTNDGIWSAPTPWYTLTTTDNICYAEAGSPRDAYVDGSADVLLVWYRTISTGTYPAGSDYQTSTDNGVTWTNLGHAEGYADFTAVPGALPAGNILWRVRGYNTDGAAGPWSAPAAIVVRAAPPVPSISSITAEARPTVAWQAAGQQAYQLRVRELYDSGAVYGADKFHKVKVWLPDGIVTIGVRVQNSFGMWSPWAEISAVIANRPGAAISLLATTRNNGVMLRWQTSGGYPQYLVYRDGAEIAATAAAGYTDYLCNGKHRYTLRGITVDGQYTLSNAAVEILTPPYAHLSLYGKWDWLTLQTRRGARPTHESEIKPDISFAHYSGRRLPVAEIAEFEDRTHSFDFTFGRSASPDSVERLLAMTGQLVVYKDCRGDFAMGVLGSLSISKDIAADVSFSIMEVDTS